jgi:hypothetical protein
MASACDDGRFMVETCLTWEVIWVTDGVREVDSDVEILSKWK